MKGLNTIITCLTVAGWIAAAPATGHAATPPHPTADGGGTALTRGIGKYPGRPGENYAPALVPSTDGTPRNLALHRMVRTSSNYDYSLTGQLLTDGITASAALPTLSVSTAEGEVPRREREWAIDCGEWTRNTLMGSRNHLQYAWHGMSVSADRIDLRCTVAYNPAQATHGYSIRLLAPERKGKKLTWRVVAQQHGDQLPGTESDQKMNSDPNKQTSTDMLPARNIQLSFSLPADCRDLTALRLEVDMDGAAYWQVFNINFYRAGKRLTADVLPSSRFGSAWMSQGEGKQWAEVDLGGEARLDDIRIKWIRRPMRGQVETSTDAQQWTAVAALPQGKGGALDIVKAGGIKARYVRISMDGGSKAVARWADADAKAYIMSELEVYGTGALAVTPHNGCQPAAGKMSLNGGDWRLQRASLVNAGGEQISTAAYKDANSWITATVPGTVLTSYVNIGALPDQNIADNMLQTSESFFNADFWYRRTFSVPQQMRQGRTLLNLDGINWKADIWLNGKRIDRIEGAFRRGKVDITPYLADGDNTLAILIHRNDNPGAIKEKCKLNTDFNGGILGADNPTFHATIGWDWISTVRGRDIGIWNDVWLESAADVLLADPAVSTQLALPDTAATMTPRVIATNVLDRKVEGTVRGWIGSIRFEKHIALAAGERREIVFAPDEYPALARQRMHLWWPNGYGEPYLYDAGFEFVADGASAAADGGSKIAYKAGIRQMTYDTPDTKLQIFINGRRVVPLGGNWGFSEVNLNYRKREYDTAVRLHRDMNYNMIRNWVGMTGDEEFYDACDRYGIMVWQDFWLANPADGPDPADERMFMDNARDYTSRYRQHPSIALYCGRNEGYPPKTIDTALRQTVDEMNPGLIYISSSADDGVSGHGPYWAEPARTYFAKQTGKLHSERGMPNIMTAEGLERTIAPSQLWPQGDAWGQHDFTQAGAQRGASFNGIIERMFGKPTSAEQFAQLAQWENYEGYRAMYESDSKYRQGLLIWMSHACWPSLTWQCYDYYFEPTAAFYGVRKACEPLHIQRNALTRNVEVVNRSAGSRQNLTATLSLLDMSGATVRTLKHTLDSPDDSTTDIAELHTDSVPEGVSGVYYLRLTLADSAGNTLSSNFYVLSTDDGNLQQLNTLPEVNLTATTHRSADTQLTVTLKNASATPAMMIRLNLKADDGDQVLPVDYSDNYFHLMPGEERTVTIDWNEEDARRQTPFAELSGFNVKRRTLR